MKPSAIFFFLALCLSAACCRAQEWPYFVTYSHDLEEPDNLEVALKTTQATPKFGNFFSGATLELEYGARGWWTTGRSCCIGRSIEQLATICADFVSCDSSCKRSDLAIA